MTKMDKIIQAGKKFKKKRKARLADLRVRIAEEMEKEEPDYNKVRRISTAITVTQRNKRGSRAYEFFPVPKTSTRR